MSKKKGKKPMGGGGLVNGAEAKPNIDSKMKGAESGYTSGVAPKSFGGADLKGGNSFKPAANDIKSNQIRFTIAKVDNKKLHTLMQSARVPLQIRSH